MFIPFTPGKPSYATRISDDEWQKYEKYIRELHDSKKSRKLILDALEKDGFKPSMGQLNSQMKKWKLDVYKTSHTRRSDGSQLKLVSRSPRHEKPGETTATPPSEAANTSHSFRKDSFLPFHPGVPRSRSRKSISDTTSVSSFPSGGKSSGTRSSRYSISSASSVMQDDLGPDKETRQIAECNKGSTSKSSSFSGFGTKLRSPGGEDQLGSSPMSTGCAKRPPPVICQPGRLAKSSDADRGTDYTRIQHGESAMETVEEFPLPWVSDYLKCRSLLPLDALVITTVGDCLFAAGYYQDAFEHYYYLVERLEAGLENDGDRQVKVLCNCARSYATQMQADLVRPLLADSLSATGVNGSTGLYDQKQKLAHLFLAELTHMERSATWEEHAEMVVSSIANSARYQDSDIEEPLRENLGMTTRLQNLSLSAFTGFCLKERHTITRNFVENAANFIASGLLRWCSNYIRKHEASVTKALARGTEQSNDSQTVSILFRAFMEGWISDAIRLECSSSIEVHDARSLFSIDSICALSEFDALSALANMIATQSLWRTSISSVAITSQNPVGHVLLHRIDYLLTQPHARIFAATYMSCITKNPADRQNGLKLTPAELSRFFIGPLVASGFLKVYLLKPTVPTREREDTLRERTRARLVQFSVDEPEPDKEHGSKDLQPDLHVPTETLAPSLHSSANSSYRRFTGLAVRIKGSSSGKSVSTSMSTSRSSNAMSIDSRGSRRSNRIFQMSSDGSIPETIEEETGLRQHYRGPTRSSDPYGHLGGQRGINLEQKPTGLPDSIGRSHRHSPPLPREDLLWRPRRTCPVDLHQGEYDRSIGLETEVARKERELIQRERDLLIQRERDLALREWRLREGEREMDQRVRSERMYSPVW